MNSARSSLIVVAPHDSGDWLWADSGGAVESGSPERLAAWYAGRDGRAQLVLLVPGEDVLLARVGMPAASPSRIARALPYALEEHVLDDPANLHCVAGSWFEGESIACAAIARKRLDGLLESLAAMGLAPDRACPDSLCIPWREGEIRVVDAGGRVLVRWGECSAAVSDAGGAGLLLQGIRDGQGLREARIERSAMQSAPDLMRLFVEHAGQLPLDLLQGEYLPQQRQAGWKTWRLPSMLAAAALVLLVVLEGLQTRQLSQLSDTLAAEIQQQFTTVFPHIGRIQTDPAPQISLELQRLRQQAGSGEDLFLDLLSRSAPALSASSGVKLESLDFRDGQLDLGLTAGQIADLDEFRRRLEANGVVARQGAAQLDNDQVSGTVTVSLAGRGAGQ